MAEFPLIENTQFEPDDEYRPEPEPEPQPPAWTDGSLRIGIHTSIAGSYLNALESARKLGCNALQIFSASPRMWQGASVRIPEQDAKAFRARRESLGLGPLVIHANYLVNLAATQPMLRTRSIQAFHEELVRGGARGGVHGAGDCDDCGERETGGAAGAAAAFAYIDREHGGNGHGGGVAAGRSGADCARAARTGCRGVPGYGAPVRGGVRHSERRRAAKHRRAD